MILEFDLLEDFSFVVVDLLHFEKNLFSSLQQSIVLIDILDIYDVFRVPPSIAHRLLNIAVFPEKAS
jgi:hypothetical protein